MKVRIKENAFVARLAAGKLKSSGAAIVFGSTIYLHNTTRQEFLNNTTWVCHELKHVHQYRHYGFVGFLFRYFFQWIQKGYYNNRFEVEARKSESDVSLLNGVEFI
ncbi:MAG TPA: DUF4157 domain-containing protein [Chitinophagaceae bacterium]|nr:DUF4157 domain-containing protein [Chitinophagaceae bacterium]MCB9055344.1 DUF4157 domain-containing protein [Chitinophagales bacterium]HPG10236.1 DUF4157 domain-containing protein [Chitinophagaceae bacterium]HRX92546.1 DUF4157 domain-containing protein [Chitinophagaceae bacterium]